MTTERTRINHRHLFLKRLLRLLLRPLLRIEAEGLDAVPAEGAVIVYFNHTNWVDPLVAAAIFDREISIMGKQELFKLPIVSHVLHAYGVIPVRRQGGDFGAFKRALEALRRGRLLVIAPEGTRSHTGALQEGKAGLIHLALHSGAMIQPVAILGCLPIRSNLRKLKRTTVVVKAGEPHRLPPRKTRPSHEEIQRMTDEAMRRLAALVPPELRGAYSDTDSEATDLVPQRAANA